MSNYSLVTRLRVRSYELDSFGHVNNSRYLNYLELARNEYMLQKGLSFDHFKKWNAAPVLVKAMIEFKAAAKTDDELEIFGKLKLEGKIRFWIDHEIRRVPEGMLILHGNLEFVFLDLSNGRPTKVPAQFAEAFSSI